MPIYEYHCLVCNRDFETLVRTSASDVECVNCGSELLERKFSVFGAKVGERVPTVSLVRRLLADGQSSFPSPCASDVG